MSADPEYYRIPSGLTPKVCAGCGAAVYSIATEHGKKLVSARFDRECQKPTLAQHGVGVDHETWDCPDAARYRQPPTGAERNGTR